MKHNTEKRYLYLIISSLVIYINGYQYNLRYNILSNSSEILYKSEFTKFRSLYRKLSIIVEFKSSHVSIENIIIKDKFRKRSLNKLDIFLISASNNKCKVDPLISKLKDSFKVHSKYDRTIGIAKAVKLKFNIKEINIAEIIVCNYLNI